MARHFRSKMGTMAPSFHFLHPSDFRFSLLAASRCSGDPGCMAPRASSKADTYFRAASKLSVAVMSWPPSFEGRPRRGNRPKGIVNWRQRASSPIQCSWEAPTRLRYRSLNVEVNHARTNTKISCKRHVEREERTGSPVERIPCHQLTSRIDGESIRWD
jgi:hypothetical protein